MIAKIHLILRFSPDRLILWNLSLTSGWLSSVAKSMVITTTFYLYSSVCFRGMSTPVTLHTKYNHLMSNKRE